VRSTASKWAKNSVLAVDAGSHLAAITRLLQAHFPLTCESPEPRPRNGQRDSREPLSPGTVDGPSEESETESRTSSDAPGPLVTILDSGPFAGLPFPHASARANALHLVREHVSTYLITHPHLDHMGGFVINTAAFHNTSRPKRVAALPFTVNAIKTHMFNNVVWPNLTDEDGGVGLVTFQRLTEGGNIALGEGPGRGYIEVVDGLGVKGFKVSHGHCMRGPSHVHRGSNANVTEPSHHPAAEGREGRSLSFSLPSQPGTPLFTGAADPGRAPPANPHYEQCVIDSSAYFIRTEPSHHSPAREILIFGDVEPDSISLSPRTHQVWAEAAPRIANRTLAGIFIECSYNNSQGDGMLYGHLCPRHLLTELQNLSEMVRESRKEHEREKEELRKGRKRKRASNGLLNASDMGVVDGAVRKTSRTRPYKDGERGDDEVMTDYAPSPKSNPAPSHERAAALPSTTHTHNHPSAPSIFNPGTVSVEYSRAVLAASMEAPLRGVKVVVIHVKDTMTDWPMAGDTILEELKEGERVLTEQGKGLGCTFEVAKSGGVYWF
jgi:cAMP phosphodiesterase